MTDLDLALLYMPRPQRGLVADYFALDAVFGQVVRTTREPMIGQMRFAWWRERLQDIDRGIVPAEPHLEGAARVVAGSGMSGKMLAEELVDRWEAILTATDWRADDYGGPVAGRGALSVPTPPGGGAPSWMFGRWSMKFGRVRVWA